MRPGSMVLALLAACGGCARAPAPRAVEPVATTTARTSADGSTSRDEVRYLALGDSFTAGTGSSPEQSFPARLASRWSARGERVTLRNLGVNGYTTRDVLRAEIPAVASFAPTLVTLAIGANNLVRGWDERDYRAQIRAIFAALGNAGVQPARVVVLPQPDWSRSPAAAGFGAPDAIAARIEGFNAILREETTAWGARYIDLFPLMRREAQAGMIAGDGLHPSARAYDEWALELAGEIRDPVPATR